MEHNISVTQSLTNDIAQPDVTGIAESFVRADAAKLLGTSLVLLNETCEHEVHTLSEQDAQFLLAIVKEREYQDSIYGDPQDRLMSEDLWIKILRDYTEGRCERAAKYDFKTRMTKGAAICMAAVKWLSGR